MSKAPRQWATAIATVALVGLLASCGAGGSTAATPTTTAARCGDQQQDCTPTQVIAAAERYYVLAGATSTEAACLAPITGSGKHAVNQAFDAPTPAQTQAAIKCVGSDRLRAIADGLAKQAAATVPGAGS